MLYMSYHDLGQSQRLHGRHLELGNPCKMSYSCTFEGNICRTFEWELRGKRPLGRPRRRYEDNIKIDLREVGCDSENWIDLAQDRDQWQTHVMMVINLWGP